MARIDYAKIAGDYTQARGLTENGLAGWREAVRPYLAGLALPVVDVGSGAGQFAALFPSWFGVQVVGVEPSAAMRDLIDRTDRELHGRSRPPNRYATSRGGH